MPLYDYVCRACGQGFEELVRAGEQPPCVACGSGDVERLLSTPTVHSESTARQARSAAKKREGGQAKDQMHERIRYENSHDRHG